MSSRMRNALIVLALVSVACMDDEIVGGTTVTGAYVLRTVNGSPPPVTVAGSGANKTEVLDDVITLFEGGSYAENGHTRVTANGQTTTEIISETGRYTPLGNSITLTSTTNRTRVATSDAKWMKIVEADATWFYSK
ncbi:MAG: hypothetical protein ACJ77R_04430 [Gemmatimonadaceae bacterium]